MSSSRDGRNREVPANTSTDYLEGIGKLVALIAVLLPAAGVTIRWIAFAIGDLTTGSSMELAYSAPVSQLVATAANALTTSVLLYLGFFGFAEIFRLRNVRHQAQLLRKGLVDVRAPRHRPIRQLKGPLRFLPLFVLIAAATGVAIATAVIIAMLVLEPDWPFALLSVVGVSLTLLTARMIVWGVERPKLRRTWPVALIAIVIPTIGAGLTGTITGAAVGNYRFTANVGPGISNGQYQELGEADGQMYLVRCTDGSLIRIGLATVDSVVYSRLHATEPPSLFDVVVRHKHSTLGFRRGC